MGNISACCSVEQPEDKTLIKQPVKSSGHSKNEKKISKHKTNSSKKNKENNQTQSGSHNRDNIADKNRNLEEEPSTHSVDKDIQDDKYYIEQNQSSKVLSKETDEPFDTVELDHLEKFKICLIEGLPVVVVLRNGKKLLCMLRLDCDKSVPGAPMLKIICQEKVRAVPLKDVKALLSTEEQLARIETQAKLIKDPLCVAIHLEECGNCIPLRFNSVEDKNLFVQLIYQLKSELVDET